MFTQGDLICTQVVRSKDDQFKLVLGDMRNMWQATYCLFWINRKCRMLGSALEAVKGYRFSCCCLLSH